MRSCGRSWPASWRGSFGGRLQKEITMRRSFILFVVTLAVAAGGVGITGCARADLGQREIQDPAISGVHWARGRALAHTGGGSPDLIYHGGPVMRQGAAVEPIYWGGKWANPSFVADKFSGLQTFYSGFGVSRYEATTTEYTDASGAHVGTTVSLFSAHVDLSQAPRRGNRSAPILTEVCNTAANLQTDGYYPVYVDTPRGSAGFCAWHSVGTCPNGVTIQFAFFFNLDGDPGCDPQDTSGLHSQGLAALANVSGHELSEALTDPHINAWFDSSGAENADKCAWAFGTPLLTFSNLSQWKIQGNWSNVAFDSGTGYPNRSGQKGCIDGGNFR